MNDREKIERIERILNENAFDCLTQEEMFENFETATIAEIKDALWKLYAFMSDVSYTLDM